MEQSPLIDPIKLDAVIFSDDLVPYNACCCTVSSCFVKVPDCYGAYGKGTFLCLHHEYTCCKPGRHTKEHLLNDGTCSLITPENCCKGTRHLCCLDTRYSFFDFDKGHVLDPDFPCLITLCGLTLVHNYMWTPMCLRNWGHIKGTSGPVLFKGKTTGASSGVPPAAAPSTATVPGSAPAPVPAPVDSTASTVAPTPAVSSPAAASAPEPTPVSGHVSAPVPAADPPSAVDEASVSSPILTHAPAAAP